ncbi:MAG: hypothetical protein JO258_06585 [Alphaproteobacteria bacterium]|nr:hypothetical protein [Alphaproteobacteria bacterium]
MRKSILAISLLAGIAAAAAAQAQSIGGRYEVHGTNFDGSPYSGTATITRSSNSTCRIRWSTGSTSEGFCMLANKSFAAAYKMGNAVGLVVYELQPDGTLEGVWTIADKSGAGTETLTPMH